VTSRTLDGKPSGEAVPIKSGGAGRRGAVWHPAKIDSPAIRRTTLQRIVLSPMEISAQGIMRRDRVRLQTYLPGTAKKCRFHANDAHLVRELGLDKHRSSRKDHYVLD
jgi:hypothetical protein